MRQDYLHTRDSLLTYYAKRQGEHDVALDDGEGVISIGPPEEWPPPDPVEWPDAECHDRASAARSDRKQGDVDVVPREYCYEGREDGPPLTLAFVEDRMDIPTGTAKARLSEGKLEGAKFRLRRRDGKGSIPKLCLTWVSVSAYQAERLEREDEPL